MAEFHLLGTEDGTRIDSPIGESKESYVAHSHALNPGDSIRADLTLNLIWHAIRHYALSSSRSTRRQG